MTTNFILSMDNKSYEEILAETEENLFLAKNLCLVIVKGRNIDTPELYSITPCWRQVLTDITFPIQGTGMSTKLHKVVISLANDVTRKWNK